MNTNKKNTDPVSDLLYTDNFAFLGLHEAAAVTGNSTIKGIVDKLANFFVRIQASSSEHPEMDGAFLRAFDWNKWEGTLYYYLHFCSNASDKLTYYCNYLVAWGSDADIGWGAWSIETGCFILVLIIFLFVRNSLSTKGWTQSWISTVLGLRLLNTSLWDVGAKIKGIDSDFKALIPVMFERPPPPPPPPPRPCLKPVIGPNNTVNITILTTDPALCATSKG